MPVAREVAAGEAHLAHRIDDRAGVELGNVDMLDRGGEKLRLAGVVDALGVLNLVQRIGFHLMLHWRRDNDRQTKRACRFNAGDSLTPIPQARLAPLPPQRKGRNGYSFTTFERWRSGAVA